MSDSAVGHDDQIKAGDCGGRVGKIRKQGAEIDDVGRVSSCLALVGPRALWQRVRAFRHIGDGAVDDAEGAPGSSE